MSNPSDQFGDFENDPRDYAMGVAEELGNERYLLIACLKFMSHDDVKQMLDDNELSPRFF
jgi:hypothetical protein